MAVGNAFIPLESGRSRRGRSDSGAAVACSAGVRWFLLEFVGDTAIYVSSHVLNRFYETREAVKARSCETVGSIYRHGGYASHVLAGHSLGSVIAYDTLNKLILDDELRGGVETARQCTRSLSRSDRYSTRSHSCFACSRIFSEIREALASATQPLISHPVRPEWINLHSRHDVFGGALDYFDPANGTSGAAPGGGRASTRSRQS